MLPPLDGELYSCLSDPLNHDFIPRVVPQTKSVKEAYLNATIGTLILTRRDFAKWELKKSDLYAITHSLSAISYNQSVTETFLGLIINILEKQTLLDNGALLSFNNDTLSLSEVTK